MPASKRRHLSVVPGAQQPSHIDPPLTDEQLERGAGVISVWRNGWHAMSPGGYGPGPHLESDFIAHLEAALRADHERDCLLDAADLAGRFLTADIAYYLPRQAPVGGEA